jgi:uracil-DNA glycosylase family 4
MTSRAERLHLYQREAGNCVRCRDHALIDRSGERWATPLFHAGSTESGLVVVLEAPNRADTYEHGRMTCDPNTDPSGRFLLELLASVGLMPEDVVMTNAVLCLPALAAGRYPVAALQKKQCSSWLRRLIVDSEATVVAAIGRKALDALELVEPHGAELAADVGRARDWFARKLVPLYHVSRLGRVNRREELQRRDFEAVRQFLRTGE